MKLNCVFCRVLCLVLCLLSLIPLAMPVAAEESQLLETRKEAETQESIAARPAAPVRYGSSAGSFVIGYLENGTELEVLKGSYNTVYKIKCFDMKGYISKDDVREVDGRYYVSCSLGEGQTRSFVPMLETQAEQLRQALYEVAQSYLGVRYRWGGTTPKGFDCSGFIRYVFEENGITLQRTAQQQASDGMIIAKEDLQIGDLVFFKGTHGEAVITHVGMYIGDGNMIHCAGKGVRVDSLESGYYKRHFLCARRIILDIPEPKATDTYRFNAGYSVFAPKVAEPTQEKAGNVWDLAIVTDKHDVFMMIMFATKDSTAE